jgi:putative FmdB family regulatory protein
MVRIGMCQIVSNRCSTCQISGGMRTLVLMPLYEYRCNDCSAVYELLRPMADREVAAVCPSCESRASMPLISRVAVHAGTGTSEAPSAGGGGGGCCGGGCGCGAN